MGQVEFDTQLWAPPDVVVAVRAIGFRVFDPTSTFYIARGLFIAMLRSSLTVMLK